MIHPPLPLSSPTLLKLAFQINPTQVTLLFGIFLLNIIVNQLFQTHMMFPVSRSSAARHLGFGIGGEATLPVWPSHESSAQNSTIAQPPGVMPFVVGSPSSAPQEPGVVAQVVCFWVTVRHILGHAVTRGFSGSSNIKLQALTSLTMSLEEPMQLSRGTWWPLISYVSISFRVYPGPVWG